MPGAGDGDRKPAPRLPVNGRGCRNGCRCFAPSGPAPLIAMTRKSLIPPALPRNLLLLPVACRTGAILLLWALLLPGHPGFGQRTGAALYLGSEALNRYLVLDKPGINRRLRFYPGTRITFKLKDDPTKYSAVLQAVGEKAILVDDTPVFLEEIRKVYYTKRGTFLPLTAASLTGGGVLFGLMGVLNGLTRENYDLLYPGAAALAAGQAIRPLYARGYRIRGNRRLRAL